MLCSKLTLHPRLSSHGSFGSLPNKTPDPTEWHEKMSSASIGASSAPVAGVLPGGYPGRSAGAAGRGQQEAALNSRRDDYRDAGSAGFQPAGEPGIPPGGKPA